MFYFEGRRRFMGWHDEWPVNHRQVMRSPASDVSLAIRLCA